MSLAPLINQAIRQLGLSPDVCVQLSPSHAEDLVQRFLTRFTGGVRPGFWWEQLTGTKASLHLPGGHGLDRLLQIVPEPISAVWVVTFWGDGPEVFDSTPKAIATVFAECSAFEYFVVPRDLSWLVGENHHDFLIAVGEPVVSRLRMLAS